MSGLWTPQNVILEHEWNLLAVAMARLTREIIPIGLHTMCYATLFPLEVIALRAAMILERASRVAQRVRRIQKRFGGVSCLEAELYSPQCCDAAQDVTIDALRSAFVAPS